MRRSRSAEARRSRIRSATAILAIVAGAVLCNPARADLASVSVSPTSAAVGTDGGSVSVVWTVNRIGAAGAGAATTSSPSATVQLNGSTLLTTGTTFSSTATIPTGAAQTLTFTETLLVPVSIARQIARGIGRATISRTFTDSSQPGNPLTRTVVLTITTGAAGGVQARRIDLSFADGNRTRVVPRNAPLRAVADLRFFGSGIFAAEWRVSAPDGPRTDSLERRLDLVRRPLSSAGDGAARLVSPALPTDRPGLYQVRLVPDDTTAGLTVPSIRYYVTPDDLTAAPELAVSAPADGGVLTQQTRFAWTPVPRAAAYQIEIFEIGQSAGQSGPASGLLIGSDGLAPLTGKVVPGTASEATLAALTLRHVAPGRDYRWRIRALGPVGEVLAVSEFRRLRR